MNIRPRLRTYSWLATALIASVITSFGSAAHAQLDGESPPTIPVEVGADAATLAGESETATDAVPVAPSRNLLTIIKNGGPLMIPIVFCSIILFLFVFERTISLRRGRVIPRPFVKRFLHQLREGQLDQEEALELCNNSGSPVAQVFAGGVNKWGRPAVEVEQGILDAGERATNGLRRNLRLLNGVATVSPLLGLLGTVVGMITAFDQIASSKASGDPSIVASGISMALLTTAAGMTVAIPALISYLFFTSKVDRLIIEIDELGQEVVAEISAEASQKPKVTRRKKAA